MSNETEFVNGLRVYAPNERAPAYIIANGELDAAALTAWLAQHPGKVRIVIKRSQGGKYYAALDMYKRESAPSKPVKGCPQQDQGGDSRITTSRSSAARTSGRVFR